MMLTLHLYRSRARLSRGGRWRWRLTAANHRQTADSGEGYHELRDAITYALLSIGGTLTSHNQRTVVARRSFDEVAIRLNGVNLTVEDATRLGFVVTT